MAIRNHNVFCDACGLLIASFTDMKTYDGGPHVHHICLPDRSAREAQAKAEAVMLRDLTQALQKGGSEVIQTI